MLKRSAGYSIYRRRQLFIFEAKSVNCTNTLGNRLNCQSSIEQNFYSASSFLCLLQHLSKNFVVNLSSLSEGGHKSFGNPERSLAELISRRGYLSVKNNQVKL